MKLAITIMKSLNEFINGEWHLDHKKQIDEKGILFKNMQHLC